MKVLDYNDEFLLAVFDQKTFLLKCPNLTLVSQVSGSFRLGSLQYGTGIAALGASSQVLFRDFRYERSMQKIQTILKLRKIKILKNLLFCVSDERILIYDIATKNNLCHIPTSNGNLVAINTDYYNLKLLYPVATNIYHEQQIWTNQTRKLQYGAASIVQYDHSGQIVCTAKENVLSLYQGEQMVRGCSFDDKITEVLPSASPRRFYIYTQNQKDQSRNLFLEVSVVGKIYLKMADQFIEGAETAIYTQQAIAFQHKGQLMIWKGQRVFKTQIDTDPNLGGMEKIQQSLQPIQEGVYEIKENKQTKQKKQEVKIKQEQIPGQNVHQVNKLEDQENSPTEPTQ